MITIKRLTPKSDDDIFFALYMANIEADIIRNLCYIGEACINIGRSTDTYKDQTGNLRNSIGYVVVNNGKIVEQVTTEENGGAGGQEGTIKGNEFLKELASECRKGVYLIVAAGMDYASYVSSKGYDVLDSAEIEAEKLMKQLGFIKK